MMDKVMKEFWVLSSFGVNLFYFSYIYFTRKIFRNCKWYLQIVLWKCYQQGIGHSLRCYQTQEEELHLQWEAHRGDHVQIPRAVCGYRGGGDVPVQEHVPVKQCGQLGEHGAGLPQHGRDEDWICQDWIHLYRRSWWPWKHFNSLNDYVSCS